MTEKLAFVASERQQEETTLLAQAVRLGIQALYLETITEAFLAGRISREDALAELGRERLAEVEYQRDAIRKDFEWALQGA